MKKTPKSNNTFLPLPVIELHTAISCDKSWDNMLPNEQGRHCQHCDQTIIDFRGKSTAEIVVIHEQSSQKVCGIYNQSQLQDKLTVPSTSIMKAALFSLIGLGLPIASKAEVPLAYLKTANLRMSPVAKIPNLDTVIASDTLVVRGRVLDAETGEGLPFAAISIRGTENSVDDYQMVTGHTDFDGNFEIVYLDKLPIESSLVILIGYVGYENQEKTVLKADLENEQFQLKLALKGASQLKNIRIGLIDIKPTKI